MAKESYDKALAEVFKHEGGYVDHPKDPGGATNMGITFAVLEAWRGKPITKADVKNLTKAEAAKIYRQNYWDKIRGDDLPAGLDLAVFDFAVNSGPKRSAEYLQRLVGVTVDGAIGPNTLKAVNAIKDPRLTINMFMDRREAFLKGLSTFPTFGKGWMSRTKQVREASLALAGPRPVTEKPVETGKQDSGSPAWLTALLAIVAAVVAFFSTRK